MKKHIHFVGIKGVGMAPLALIAKEAGCQVTGSDIDKEFITDATLHKAGITPLIGFAASHITTPDLVITTGAHGGFDNIEVITAREKNIPVITQGEAVGKYLDGSILRNQSLGISVTGTHGKTTTTAMLATILATSEMDPSYIIGTGNVGSLPAPGHFGKGKPFVVEADEYVTEPTYDRTIKFLWQHPDIAIITNIEYDHPDVYTDLDEVKKAFAAFITRIKPSGVLIACGDDPNVRAILADYEGKVITYGVTATNDYIAEKLAVHGEQMSFAVTHKDTVLGEFILNVVGEHNVVNALGAIIAAFEAGASLEQVQEGIAAFRGSKRRLEFIGTLVSGAKVYDDYAHHPTEIKKTLAALRQQYPEKKIVCIFQPHTYSRTKLLFTEFSRAFDAVNELFVVITDIYASLRERPDKTVSAQRLASEITLQQRNAHYLPTLSDVVQYINEKQFGSDTIVVTMGAGDVYTIHAQLEFV